MQKIVDLKTIKFLDKKYLLKELFVFLIVIFIFVTIVLFIRYSNQDYDFYKCISEDCEKINEINPLEWMCYKYCNYSRKCTEYNECLNKISSPKKISEIDKANLEFYCLCEEKVCPQGYEANLNFNKTLGCMMKGDLDSNANFSYYMDINNYSKGENESKWRFYVNHKDYEECLKYRCGGNTFVYPK